MKHENAALSDAEWRIMQSLWRGDEPMSVREILDDLQDAWSVHSVISFLKRMEAKGAVKIHDGRPIRYSAALDRSVGNIIFALWLIGTVITGGVILYRA